ncbi:hypothetical protein IAQ67_28565 (plasmid) [Paenibacillus peoriae]|uniref:Uncharacterized protein n=1 Tax=Paenibacillus peoriae TaxID=59893 RepID=A0A7H0YHA8_9BACL|nr:zinc finger-like domain-containing protein [Paenibacillus peoriae]QNR70466.1 hypothetical protein IAQ67_28565 [Paenibacillus peoriae]
MTTNLTVLEAAKKWVSEFNAIPQTLITKAYPIFDGEIEVLATPYECCNCGNTEYTSKGGTPELITCTECDGSCEVDGNKCDACAGSGLVSDQEQELEDIRTCTSCGGTEFQNTYGFPMWGTMWTFGDSLDEDWVTNRGGADIMRECGFWVYSSDELGVFFGIDGAGYDFYEGHWVPLYKARGLKWHAEEGQPVRNEPNNLYVVLYDYGYDTSNFDSVWSTKEAAEERTKIYNGAAWVSDIEVDKV